MNIFIFNNAFFLSRQLQVVKLIKSHQVLLILKHLCSIVSEIGAVVKAVDFHLCGWSSIPGISCSFLIGVCVIVDMFIKSFCYHYIVKKPKGYIYNHWTSCRILICYQIKITSLLLLLYIALFDSDNFV